MPAAAVVDRAEARAAGASPTTTMATPTTRVVRVSVRSTVAKVCLSETPASRHTATTLRNSQLPDSRAQNYNHSDSATTCSSWQLVSDVLDCSFMMALKQ